MDEWGILLRLVFAVVEAKGGGDAVIKKLVSTSSSFSPHLELVNSN